MSSLGLSQSPMNVELRLDETEPAYTHQDTVSGEVILHTESPADLSTIVLNLSGTATSRLTQSRRTETHNCNDRKRTSYYPIFYRNSTSDRMLQNRSMVKQAANSMRKYCVLASKEIPSVEADPALNRKVGFTS
ncbi:hypothetical protein N7453_012265 [Penicillium expansum]|nr:hypothetical protein N7453_012265 [Penicillium expansum]